MHATIMSLCRWGITLLDADKLCTVSKDSHFPQRQTRRVPRFAQLCAPTCARAKLFARLQAFGFVRGKRSASLWPLVVLATMMIVSVSAKAAADGRCIVIDSDAGLDDFRAVAALAALSPKVPAQRVAAVIITEGLARTPEGAGAMRTFLESIDLGNVPVLRGTTPNPKRRFLAGHPLPSGLPEWRQVTERLNHVLPEPVRLSDTGEDLPVRLRQETDECRSVSLLVIGPWTSFIRYAPDLLDRVERIVVQGRPYPDELGGDPTGFNCVYDIDSCFAAFDLLVGRQRRSGAKFRATWVDIPASPEPCGAAEPGVDEHGNRLYAFRPIPSWADDLELAAEKAEEKPSSDYRGRVARGVAKLLRSNPSALKQTSLWDDLAALYLMRPELFAVRGGHVEPCVPAATVRAALTDAMIVPPRR